MSLDATALSVQPEDVEKPASARHGISVFLCANCARTELAATSFRCCLPSQADLAWPWPVKQVLVPCAGRLQPAHVLKAFESGAAAVCMIACNEDDCDYVEGSRRCARRADFLRSLLEEIGLGGERLMLFHLSGTAGSLETQMTAIRDEAIGILRALPPNPLHKTPVAGTDDGVHEEVELSDDYNEQ